MIRLNMHLKTKTSEDGSKYYEGKIKEFEAKFLENGDLQVESNLTDSQAVSARIKKFYEDKIDDTLNKLEQINNLIQDVRATTNGITKNPEYQNCCIFNAIEQTFWNMEDLKNDTQPFGNSGIGQPASASQSLTRGDLETQNKQETEKITPKSKIDDDFQPVRKRRGR